ncbi:MAG: NTP transferase domain-containing protein [Trueperaceae bacterium]|nr:NTP transferase domain-containing protein [Trueperaceae bacterium]
MSPDAPRPPHRPAPVTAVVLAGGGPGDALARAVGAPAKALVPLKGRPLGAYVLDALLGARHVRRIVWVGAHDAAMGRRLAAAPHRVVPGGPRLLDSLTLGLGAARVDAEPDERLLLVGADVPWVEAAHVDRFVADARDADVVYPVVARRDYEPRFAAIPRTWVRTADGPVTGGNLVLATPDALTALLPWIDVATRLRKAPWRLAAAAGPRLLAAWAFGRITPTGVERRARTLLEVRVALAWGADPELATDVDRVDQLPATLGLPDPDAPSASGA